MTLIGWVQIAIFSIILLLVTKPIGLYMTQVMEEGNSIFETILGPLERLIYRLLRINPQEEMHWTTYAYALIAFSLIGTIFTYAILRLQGILPFNPMGFSTASAPAYATALTPDLAFNTAVSFTTNTNWQNYSGETTMSYLSQMLALAYHNWISAASGYLLVWY